MTASPGTPEPALAVTHLSPRQRWGTCCPFDPECEHSFMDDDVLANWMDAPITDEKATAIVAGDADEVLAALDLAFPDDARGGSDG